MDMPIDVNHHYAALYKLALRADVTLSQWKLLQEHTTLRDITAGTKLIETGQQVDRAFFCVSGLFRLYYLLEDGREYNVAFTLEGDFATSHAAMIAHQPSSFTIEALEDSLVIEIEYDLLQQWMRQHHSWERFVRLSVERLYLRKEERERELLYLSAKQRYYAFLHKYPGLAQRIAQYHIASYIGISPVSLSRLLHQEEDGME
ncbi:Crp/Fnr family transcriptional regulator [Paenibacillus wenxiniae]|uniref:Crp/Fnr family transcriptional regulator n=1 Tax=Paenibacillus wenxiniae TaxID=1636843 RepID=A0ABW4RG97_9BACL